VRASRGKNRFPFDREKQAAGQIPAHVEDLVDVGTPGQKMPWIHSLGIEARERKARQERQGNAIAYQLDISDRRSNGTHAL
jgi:hypothetical protein